jgi:hypothetical protein
MNFAEKKDARILNFLFHFILFFDKLFQFQADLKVGLMIEKNEGEKKGILGLGKIHDSQRVNARVIHDNCAILVRHGHHDIIIEVS